jgi:hypothetical protein
MQSRDCPQEFRIMYGLYVGERWEVSRKLSGIVSSLLVYGHAYGNRRLKFGGQVGDFRPLLFHVRSVEGVRKIFIITDFLSWVELSGLGELSPVIRPHQTLYIYFYTKR